MGDLNKSQDSFLSIEGEREKLVTAEDASSFHSAMEALLATVEPDKNDAEISKRTMQIAFILERTAQRLRKRVKKYDSYDKRNRSKRRKIPSNVSENIFVITVVWQIICVVALEMIDLFGVRFAEGENDIFIAGVIIMTAFQASNLVLAIAVTVKLMKQYMHHTATLKFLLQSYASTIILFAGLYTFIARVKQSWFFGLNVSDGGKAYALRLFGQLLFSSISTGTLCGASNVVAVHPVTELMMGCQMMLSFVYFGSIISQVINPNDFELVEKKDDKVNSASSKSKSFEKSLARFKKTLRSNRSLDCKPRTNYGALEEV